MARATGAKAETDRGTELFFYTEIYKIFSVQIRDKTFFIVRGCPFSDQDERIIETDAKRFFSHSAVATRKARKRARRLPRV